MNPWHLDASGLMVWGLVAHLVADWPLQNDWMARNKPNLRHPAGWVHAGIHGLLLALVFAWAAIPVAVAHLLIDTRVPVAWWSRLVGQTQPAGRNALTLGVHELIPRKDQPGHYDAHVPQAPLYDVGTEVRFWTDQVFHVACVAVAAIVAAAL